MAKAVLISIRPEWVEKIVSGEKTVEIRKTRPNLKTPFKCYIYCTDGTGKNTVNIPITQERLRRHYAETGSMECLNCPIGNRKVIGEFICRAIYCRTPDCLIVKEDTEDAIAGSCLSADELRKYLFGKRFGKGPVPLFSIPDFYRWSIYNLKIYDTPKELSEFHAWKKCNSCGKSGYESTACAYDENCQVPAVVTCPPQSWCYVEELTKEEVKC